MFYQISKYLWVFFLSTFKYMFSPLVGFASGFSFSENHLTTYSGAFCSATIFYWGANYFNERYRLKVIKKNKKRIEEGKQKINIFTKRNKIIIKIKKKIGYYGLVVLAPIFLSIPIGSIIVAKFYGKRKTSYIYILIVLYIYSFVSCLFIDKYK